MLPGMEAKQPFSDQDWQATPELVRQYIRQLEQTFAVLVNKVKELEKRTEKLESKTNQKSQNSSKPCPSGKGAWTASEKTSKHLLADQAIFLYFIKKTAKNDRFWALGNTFQGQNHGFKDFEVS